MRRCRNPLSVDPKDSSYFLPLNNMYLGVEVMDMLQTPEVARNPVMIKDVLEHFGNFLIISVQEIRARLDFNDPVLIQFENITPKKVSSEASLISFMNLFPRIKKIYQNIDTNWRMFSVIEFDPVLHTFLLNLNAEEFWIKLKRFEKDDKYLFKDVSNFILTILSLPQSNVSCE